jgi:hypothetical protein
MRNSLQKHGIPEAKKQLKLRMKNRGLDSIQVLVTRKAGKLEFDFTGSAAQVVTAREIFANWN